MGASEKNSGDRYQNGSLWILGELRGWTRDIVFAGVRAILIIVFVVQPVRVEGTSMQPHLVNQERVFVNKLLYRFSEIERHDVVVFWYPKDRKKPFIKRVIGLPGDTIEVRASAVYVNGNQLQEEYVRTDARDYQAYPSVTVPEGSYYVMGDHRSSSNDSRHWGCVPAELIFGRAIFRYWPVSKIGLLD